MPRPTDDDPLGLRQIDRLLGFLKRRLRLLRGSRTRRSVTSSARTGAAAAPFAAWSARNAPIWNVTKCGAGPCGTTSAVSLPWNIGRTNAVAPPAALDAGDVGDERAVEARGELRREVARLIGVRQQHERRRQLRRSPAAAPPCSRRACTARAPACSTVTTSLTCGGGELGRDRADAARPARATAIGRRVAASCCAAAIVSHVARLSLPSRCSAMTRIIAITRASSRSLRTSSLAASAGEPRDHLRLLALLGHVEADDLAAAATRRRTRAPCGSPSSSPP